jgi:transposase
MNMDAQKPSPEPNDPPETLFPLPPTKPPEIAPAFQGRPRMQRPERQQMLLRSVTLEALVPEDHPVRLVWAYVERLDLTALEATIRAVEGRAGRDPIDLRILMALWLYATVEGVGAARALDRLCEHHQVYQWICGGVSVNYHTLADFRVGHGEYLDQLLTGSVAGLMHQGLVTLARVAQDGMRVRAGAGAGSFRRRSTLEECRKEAAVQVEALRREVQDDPAATNRRQQAARQRAARERVERIERALAQMPAVEAAKKPDDKGKARVSTTDAEVRVMKMADGGFRPAVNVQLATDTGTQIITGLDVSNNGSDGGQMVPMLEQHRDRYQRLPDETLVDGGFATKDDIDRTGDPDLKTVVYAPIRKPRKEGQDPHATRYGDTPTIIAWRGRMATPEAQEIYKDRASTAECVNAIARNRGLHQFQVRGRTKIRAVVLWYVLAHNLIRVATLSSLALLHAAKIDGSHKK